MVTEVRDALRQPPRPITVVAPSREEALAIVCASLLGDGDEVDELRARAVIVSAPGAWDRLVDSGNGLDTDPELRRRGHYVRAEKGHHVLIPLGRDARHDEGHIVVPLLDRAAAAEASLDAATGITRDIANRPPRTRTATSCRSAGPSRPTRGSRGHRGPRVSRAVASPR